MNRGARPRGSVFHQTVLALEADFASACEGGEGGRELIYPTDALIPTPPSEVMCWPSIGKLAAVLVMRPAQRWSGSGPRSVKLSGITLFAPPRLRRASLGSVAMRVALLA